MVGAIIFLLVLVSYRRTPGLAVPSCLMPSVSQNDLGEYLYGEPSYEFHVDNEITSDLQLNVDLTVAMPCRCALPTSAAPLSAPTFLTTCCCAADVSIDLRDVVGDRLHLSDDFVKDGVSMALAADSPTLL